MAPLAIVCSNCSGQLIVPPEVVGKLVKCPLCKIVFPAPLTENAPAPIRNEPSGDQLSRERLAKMLPPRNDAGNDAVPSVRKPLYDDEDDPPPGGRWSRYDNDDDVDFDRRYRPGPRYGNHEDDNERFEHPAQASDNRLDRMPNPGRFFIHVAESAVTGLAVGIMIIGGVFVLVGMVLLLSTFDRHIFQNERANGLAWAILFVCWGGFIMLGGVMMKNLKSYGLAMTTTIMICINRPYFVLHLMLAVWAFVVLNKTEVKQAFRWKANQP